MKENNRFVSFIVALTMILSSFSGLTINASAEGEPALSDWTLTKVSESDISNWSAQTESTLNKSDPIILTNASDKEDWTIYNSRGDLTQIGVETIDSTNALYLAYTTTYAQYNKKADSGYFYYQYTIRTASGDRTQTIKIVGSEGESASLDVTSKATYQTFTTVIDVTNKNAYTYNSSDELVKTTDLSSIGTINGIKFQGQDSSSAKMYVNSVIFGTATKRVIPDAPSYSDLTFNKVYSMSDDADLSALDSHNWSAGRTATETTGTLTSVGSITRSTDNLSFVYNRYVKYSNMAASGLYYYKYKVRMYNTTAENQNVKLVGGGSEYPIVSSTAKENGQDNYDYITVVDTQNSVAYTYNYDGTYLKPTDFNGDTITGIKFENIVDSNQINTFQIYTFEYGTIADTPTQAEDPIGLKIDYVNEIINTTEALEYSTDNKSTWAACTDDMSVSSFGWDGTTEKTVYFRTAENGNVAASEGNAYVTIPARPASPNAVGNKPANEGNTGTITGVDGRMEYILKSTFDSDSSAAWTSVPSSETSVSVVSGAYYVRVKASNDKENFAGEKATVTVPEYIAETYTIKGTISEAGSVSKIELKGEQDYTFNATNGTEVTFKDVLAGTYDIVVTAAEGYKNGTSNPTQIIVSGNNDNAFAASATELATVNITTSTVPLDVGSITLTPNSSTAKENSKISVQASAVTGYDTPVIEYSTDGTNWNVISGELEVGAADIKIRATYTAKTFTINKASVIGGSITVADSAAYNSSVSVSLVPQTGYEAGAITVTGDVSSSNIPVTGGEFIMPAEDVTVSATFINTTPADTTSKLSYWTTQTMTEKDNNTFANSDDEKDNLNAKIIQEIEGTDAISNWTFESKTSSGGTRADNTRVSANNKGELTITYDGAAIYTRSAETGAYYYKYTISMSEDGTGNNQTVRLTGITNGTLFTSPNAGGSFTTVISPSDSKAYTYDESGDLVSESTITIGSGEKVTGIEFRSANNSNKNIKVSNFSYGLIGDAKEPEPPMLDTTLGEWQTKFDNAAYTFEFDTTLTDEVIFGEKGIWVTDGTTGNQGDVWQRADKELTVLQIRNGKSATLTKTPPVDVYYYTYNLYNNGANTVKLEGIADGIIIEFTANKAYTQYTTVVDTVNGKVYTYEGTDTETQPIKVNVIGENEMISGITFASGGGYMYLDNFAYGLTKGETDPDPYNPNGGGSTTDPTPGPTAEPTPEPSDTNSKLSDWDLTEASVTEVFDGKSITDLQADDWRFGNTNAGANFNEKHVIINGSGELEINWYGTATYGKTDENESFYYTYTVKTKDTAGMRSVKLSGADNSTMIVSGKEITSSERTFTTVVDVNSKKAYTYDTATGDFVSVVDLPDPSAVNGITFSGGTENVNAGMQVDNVSYGLVNIMPPEKPVTIVLTSDSVNEGEKLENNETYEITGEKFTETVIKFNEPYSSKEGKTLLYMTNSIVITSPSNANGNIIVDGTKITALEALTAGAYDISVAVKSEYKGEEYGSETYTVRLVKPEVTDEDISNEYKPVITTETVSGKEITVSTDTASPTEIYKDLELPTETSFANITWTSDNKDILSDSGNVVKRPLEDTTVTLTALIANKYNSGSTVTKQITVVVKGIGNMLDDAIAKAKAAITKVYDEDGDIDITGLSDLHQDIKLYTEYEKNDEYPEYDDVTLLWSSSNNDVLKINGGVAEIYPLTTNEYKITLTINASALGQEKEENIDVTVHLTADNAGDRYAVRCDDLAASNFSDVANYSGDTVSSNISIPTEGMFGSIISWTSSVPMYMSNTGTYTAPASDTKVTLTGIVSKGTVISDKKHAYSFTVKGKNKNQSSGGGGSSSGSTGGSTSSFSVPSANITKPLATANPSSSDNYNQNTDTEPEGFTDLGNVAWAREAINALADKGIISGRSEHIFDPDANITRAEFATIIVKAFGFEDENANADEFADVSENDWYYSFVAAAYNNGIINGYDNGTFGSSDNITRQDMAVIIYRAAKAAGIELDEVNEAKNFDDNDFIAAYAREAIDTLVKAGVINGISETEFAPAANATRAQAAKMIYEFVK